MIATKSLAWSIWQRNSRWLMLIAGIMALFCLFVRAFNGESQHPTIFAIGSLLVFFCYLGLMGIFMYQDSDVGVKGSAYPKHMFTLPVRTFQLVLIPTLLGTSVFLGSGLLISKLIHDTYEGFPLYWPAMVMAAMYLMLTAIFWYPFGVPYSKLFLTLASIPTLIYLVACALENRESQTLVCQWLAAFMVFCIAVAYNGVVRARRGEVQLFWWQSLEPKTVVSKKFKWLSFRSPYQAQRWYEWRQHGIILPSLTLFLCVLFVMPLLGQYLSLFGVFSSNSNSIVSELGQDQNGLQMMASPYIHTYMQLFVFLVPVVAWIVGCGARRSDVKNSDRNFYLFFGTRPMSDGGLVAQKLWAAFRSSVIAWAIVLVLFLGLFQQRGGLWDPSQQVIVSQGNPIWSMLLARLSPIVVLYFVLALTLLLVITWRNYAIGYWTELSGKTLLRYGYPIGLIIAIFTIPQLIDKRQPTYQDVELVYVGTLVIVWTINAVRALSVVWLVRKQLETGVMKNETLKRGVLTYCLALSAATGFTLLLSSTFRAEFVEEQIYTSSQAVWFIVGLTFLWTPIVRILLATEMLHQNRHRAS